MLNGKLFIMGPGRSGCLNFVYAYKREMKGCQ